MRYKVFYGGRASGKSWSIARALILRAIQEPIQVLCVRELQTSIEESVHRLLELQIYAMGVAEHFKIENRHIYSSAGAVFSFEGIARNVNKIKSMEGVDICWVEEAAKVSRNSWNVLIPTIRKEGSEIWISMNPELDTDEAYLRFIKSPPANAFSVSVNWQDNPWFNIVNQTEMEQLRERDFDEYLHVWEGHCRANLQGAVYAKELRNALSDGRICKVPYSKEAPVDTFWDLGRRDMTSIWFAQRVGMEYRVIDFFEDSQEDITYYIRALQGKPYVYGVDYLPHDAKAKTIGTKRSVEEQMKAANRKVRIVPKLSIEDGHNAARTLFPSLFIDEVKCAEGLQHLRRYRYDVNNEGTLSVNPVHDEHSHAADAFRYMGVALRPPKEKKKLNLWSGEDDWGSSPGLGWMR